MNRSEWCELALSLCLPVLTPLSEGEFHRVFPDKKPTARLEAFARALLGLAQWIELDDEPGLAAMARNAIANATDPCCPDYMVSKFHDQALVECALLAQALLRAPTELWRKLQPPVKLNVINFLKSSRAYQPHDNNWVLFPSMVEALLSCVGEQIVEDRLMGGLAQYMKWYSGDGSYMDGEEHHHDYYNSYIIQPMLYDILRTMSKTRDGLRGFQDMHEKRMQRWCVLQERCISPDGSFPPVGRSLTYRCGAFHALALCASCQKLPPQLPPGQVRVALSKVIAATLKSPGTFENGWLTKGLYGRQPGLAEPYISVGSLYLCATVFAPLGLSVDSVFWTDEDRMITWEKVRNGDDVQRDRPYVECVRKRGRIC